jgi:hypothetical protein
MSVGRTSSRRVPVHSVSRLGYSPLGCIGSTAPMPCIRTRCLRRSTSLRSVAMAPAVHPVTVARRRLLRLHRASGCLGSSRDSSPTSPTPRFVCLSTSHGSSRGSSSITSPRVGLSSTTSPTPRVRVPRHVTRLVVDYFTHVARPGASARHSGRRRLLRLHRASGSHGMARHAARRRLLRLRCTSGCFGTSRSSSSTTSPTPRVRVPRHNTSRSSLLTTSPMSHVRVPRLVARLVIDCFAYAARSGASAHCAAHH